MLKNHAKLINFFQIADELTGRKKMQKMIYILQKSGVPFEEKFAFHFYGPYSEELTLRVEELCNLGFLQEKREDKSSYYQYHYQITEDGKAFLEEFPNELPLAAEKVGYLKSKSSRFLELVATLLYFDDLPAEDAVEKLHKVKPKQKFTEDEIKSAFDFINKIQE